MHKCRDGVGSHWPAGIHPCFIPNLPHLSTPPRTPFIHHSGIRRARFRDSFEEPSYLVPGQTYRLEVDLNVTSNLFKAVRMSHAICTAAGRYSGRILVQRKCTWTCVSMASPI